MEQLVNIENVEYVKNKLNNMINKSRNELFNSQNKDKTRYLELIEDMRKLNLLDKEVIKKYLNEEKIMEKKKIDFCIGIFDDLSENGLEKIRKDIANCQIYAIGVYTEKIIIEEFFTQPINTLEKRMKTAKNIPGVSFVFPLDTNEPEKIKEIVKLEYSNFISKNN